MGPLAPHAPGGTTNACAAVVPDMVRAGRGTVVALSSWLAFAGVAGEAYQAAATGSILAFIKSFAVEVAPEGVRVNCIAVGPLDATPPQASVLPAEIADSAVFRRTTAITSSVRSWRRRRGRWSEMGKLDGMVCLVTGRPRAWAGATSPGWRARARAWP